MSVRWMAVQYVGNMLRLPVVNDGDMDKPFGSSVLERDVKRIIVNPFSDSPQTFVPESENVKLRELVQDMYHVIAMLQEAHDEAVVSSDGVMLDTVHFAKRLREMGIEVTE